MTIVEKAAYLKGLAEGLGMDESTKEGKLWAALNDLLGDIAHEISDLQDSNMDFADALDEMSEDLTYLEELTCDLDKPEDMDDWDAWDEWDDEDDQSCCSCGECIKFNSDDDGDEENGDEPDEDLVYDGIVYDVTCPKCGEEISFDEDTLAQGFIECPGCGEKLEFDLDEE